MKYMRDNPEARLISLANQTERRVSELRKKRRQLIEAEASKERVKLIDMQITANMRRFNERVESLSK